MSKHVGDASRSGGNVRDDIGSHSTLGDILTNPTEYGRSLKRGLGREFQRAPIVTCSIIAGIMLLLTGFAYFAYVGSTAPTASELDREQFAKASVVYAADGEEITQFYDNIRMWVPLDSMAAPLKEATLAVEDQRFYEHFGVDIHRTIGAIWATLHGSDQGGSTITMQLARNVYPELQDDFVLTRKIREWSTARHIERQFEKDEILEMYLNLMPFSHNAFGVEAASETYFQRSAAELNTRQAATLVAMLRGPTLYNPVRNPELSLDRRNLVLGRMMEVGYLELAEYDELVERETELDFNRIEPSDNIAPFFVEQVRRQVRDWADENGYNIYSDGLQIHTTLDSELQTQATEIATQHLEELQTVVDVTWSSADVPVRSRNTSDYQPYHDEDTAFDYFWQENPETLNAFLRGTDEYEQALADGRDEQDALQEVLDNEVLVDSIRTRVQRLETGLVAMEPATGNVRAWVGGRDFNIDRFDRVSQSQRQPGSTFKPFVFAAALENGMRPNDRMEDRQFRFEAAQADDSWEPSNFAGITGSTISLRAALAQSVNTVTALLTLDVGPERVAQQARRMGIMSEMAPYPSLGLGTSDVTLLEMAVAYSTIANNGTRPTPLTVTRIEDRHGNVLENFHPSTEDVMSEYRAHDLLDMLRSVVNNGTGVSLNQYMSGDLAGKTGTTQNGADGWFMAMHPELVIGGWIGFNNPALTFRERQWGVGSRTALPMVGRVGEIAGLSPDVSFREPPGWTDPSDSPGQTITFAEVRSRFDESLGTISVTSRSRTDSLNQAETISLPTGGDGTDDELEPPEDELEFPDDEGRE